MPAIYVDGDSWSTFQGDQWAQKAQGQAADQWATQAVADAPDRAAAAEQAAAQQQTQQQQQAAADQAAQQAAAADQANQAAAAAAQTAQQQAQQQAQANTWAANQWSANTYSQAASTVTGVAPAPASTPAAPATPPQSQVDVSGDSQASATPSVTPSTSLPSATSGNYVAYAWQAAQKAGIDPSTFVRQIQQESGFAPFNSDGSPKTSPAGALGIAQFMPGTAKGLGVDPTDPLASLDAAANLMGNYVQKYGGDYGKALAAYNAGPGNVDKFGGIPPFAETQSYVKTILGDAGGLAGQLAQQAQQGIGDLSQRAAGIVQNAVTNVSQNLRPSQFQMGLSNADAYAACGPAAAIAFARAIGRNPTPQEAMDLARQVGWTPDQGMAGPSSEMQLLKGLGVTAHMEQGVDASKVAADVNNGNPVMLSTPGHYFVADGFNPQNNTFHVGTSGTDLRAGSEWMTLGQMQQAMGTVQASLYLDRQPGDGPSVAAAMSGPTTMGQMQPAQPSASADPNQASSMADFIQRYQALRDQTPTDEQLGNFVLAHPDQPTTPAATDTTKGLMQIASPFDVVGNIASGVGNAVGSIFGQNPPSLPDLGAVVGQGVGALGDVANSVASAAGPGGPLNPRTGLANGLLTAGEQALGQNIIEPILSGQYKQGLADALRSTGDQAALGPLIPAPIQAAGLNAVANLVSQPGAIDQMKTAGDIIDKYHGNLDNLTPEDSAQLGNAIAAVGGLVAPSSEAFDKYGVAVNQAPEAAAASRAMVPEAPVAPEIAPTAPEQPVVAPPEALSAPAATPQTLHPITTGALERFGLTTQPIEGQAPLGENDLLSHMDTMEQQYFANDHQITQLEGQLQKADQPDSALQTAQAQLDQLRAENQAIADHTDQMIAAPPGTLYAAPEGATALPFDTGALESAGRQPGQPVQPAIASPPATGGQVQPVAQTALEGAAPSAATAPAGLQPATAPVTASTPGVDEMQGMLDQIRAQGGASPDELTQLQSQIDELRAQPQPQANVAPTAQQPVPVPAVQLPAIPSIEPPPALNIQKPTVRTGPPPPLNIQKTTVRTGQPPSPATPRTAPTGAIVVGAGGAQPPLPDVFPSQPVLEPPTAGGFEVPNIPVASQTPAEADYLRRALTLKALREGTPLPDIPYQGPVGTGGGIGQPPGRGGAQPPLPDVFPSQPVLEPPTAGGFEVPNIPVASQTPAEADYLRRALTLKALREGTPLPDIPYQGPVGTGGGIGQPPGRGGAQPPLPGFQAGRVGDFWQVLNAYHSGNVIMGPATAVKVGLNTMFQPAWNFATQNARDLATLNLNRVWGRTVGAQQSVVNLGADFMDGFNPAMANRVQSTNPLVNAFLTAQTAVGGSMHAGMQNVAAEAVRRMELGAAAGEHAAESGGKAIAGFNQISALIHNPQGLPQNAIARANDLADRAGLRSPAGATQQLVQNMLNQAANSPAGAVTNFLLPVFRIGAQATARGVEASPFGLAGTAFDVARGAAGMGPYAQGFNQYGGAVTPLADRLVNNIAGTAVTAFLASKALDGTVTGVGPADPQARANLEAQGWRPQSVVVPGMGYVSYTRLPEQLRTPLMLAGSFGDAANGHKGDLGAAAQDLAREVGQAFAQGAPGLSMLGDLKGIASGDPYAVGYLAGGSSAGYIPGSAVLSQAAQFGDPYARKTPTNQGFGPAIAANIQQGIPGLREQLQAQMSVLGQAMPNPSQGIGGLLPWRTPGEIAPGTPGLQSLALLNQAGLVLSAAPKTVALAGGRSVELSDDEKQQYEANRAVLLDEMTAGLRNDDRYANASMKIKQTILDRLVRQADSVAGRQVVGSIAQAGNLADRMGQPKALQPPVARIQPPIPLSELAPLAQNAQSGQQTPTTGDLATLSPMQQDAMQDQMAAAATTP